MGELFTSSRFQLTRAWFAISLGHTIEECTVIDATPSGTEEVWRITTRSLGQPDCISFALSATGEVLGPAPSPAKSADKHTLRTDWVKYVEGGEANGSLWDRLRWADMGEYHRGVSVHWLRRSAEEGEERRAKQTVAYRYVLVSVVENRCILSDVYDE